MTVVAGPSHGSGESLEQHRAVRDALISLLTALWFPFAVTLLPVMGAVLGLTGHGGLIDVLRALVLAGLYFGPFLLGIVFGWRALRHHLHGGIAAVAWIGLLGNIAVLAISVSFLLGEFANPH